MVNSLAVRIVAYSLLSAIIREYQIQSNVTDVNMRGVDGVYSDGVQYVFLRITPENQVNH